MDSFFNNVFKHILDKYDVRHKIPMNYHPQTNVKVELSNKEIKRNLENVMNPTRKGWSLHSMVLYGI